MDPTVLVGVIGGCAAVLGALIGGGFAVVGQVVANKSNQKHQTRERELIEDFQVEQRKLSDQQADLEAERQYRADMRQLYGGDCREFLSEMLWLSNKLGLLLSRGEVMSQPMNDEALVHYRRAEDLNNVLLLAIDGKTHPIGAALEEAMILLQQAEVPPSTRPTYDMDAHQGQWRYLFASLNLTFGRFLGIQKADEWEVAVARRREILHDSIVAQLKGGSN